MFPTSDDEDGEYPCVREPVPNWREEALRRAEASVACLEHDRPVATCRRLAEADYGQPAFDNCRWEAES